MHALVFTRSTPDTEAKITVDGSGNVSWGDEKPIVNPWDEYALEEAIAQAKELGGTTTVIALGGEIHLDALKHSLAMGMKQAIRIEDEALDETDGLAYATTAAGAVEKIGDVSVVFCGKESIDVGTDQHTYMIARKLGWPMLSYVSKILEIDYEAKTIKVEKMLEQGKQVITSKLPAVISVMKGINEPRYPSFIGIRKAGKAQIPVWDFAELGIEAPAKTVSVAAFKNPPVKEVQVEMLEGDAEQQAAALVEKLLEEKVL